ncbi:MAG TPA: hypothetical protein VK110_03550, partial [Salinisphaeraceae bacterium]|nr:hypothetical protein [Salinisphaeraceae bacterium]
MTTTPQAGKMTSLAPVFAEAGAHASRSRRVAQSFLYWKRNAHGAQGNTGNSEACKGLTPIRMQPVARRMVLSFRFCNLGCKQQQNPTNKEGMQCLKYPI